MYESYWGLREKPFENTPNPRFLYRSREHNEALSRFIYAVKEKKGLAMFTGEYGSGKTLVSMYVLRLLKDDQNFQVVMIVNPKLSFIEFMREIVYQLKGELPRENNKLDLLHMVKDLIAVNNTSGRHTVIIIDESQMIQERDVFEELRLISNLQLEDKFMVTIVFIGQPELRGMMDNIPQLKQRLAITHHLGPLSEEETNIYIKHRLHVAGGREDIFKDEAIRAIYKSTGGIPRKINTVCDICLVIGCGEKAKDIDEELVSGVVKNIV